MSRSSKHAFAALLLNHFVSMRTRSRKMKARVNVRRTRLLRYNLPIEIDDRIFKILLSMQESCLIKTLGLVCWALPFSALLGWVLRSEKLFGAKYYDVTALHLFIHFHRQLLLSNVSSREQNFFLFSPPRYLTSFRLCICQKGA